jgi:hypothetical protein
VKLSNTAIKRLQYCQNKVAVPLLNSANSNKIEYFDVELDALSWKLQGKPKKRKHSL